MFFEELFFDTVGFLVLLGNGVVLGNTILCHTHLLDHLFHSLKSPLKNTTEMRKLLPAPDRMKTIVHWAAHNMT